MNERRLTRGGVFRLIRFAVIYSALIYSAMIYFSVNFSSIRRFCARASGVSEGLTG